MWNIVEEQSAVQQIHLTTLRSVDCMSNNNFTIEEAAALLYAVVPNYPDLRAMNPVSEVSEFLRSLHPFEFETTEPLN
jgi:hypothetical protein